MYCNALRVLQERWRPDMSWTVLQLVFPANLLSLTLHSNSTGTVANAMTVFALKLFLHVVQLCGYWQVSRWLCPHNGWLHLPYETRGMLPRLISCRQWHVWKPLPGLFASSLSLLAPPFRGGSDFLDHWIGDRSWLSRGWLLRSWRPTPSWPERTLREILW